MTASTPIELYSGRTASDLLAVVADPIRWELLRRLTTGGCCVCTLQEHVTVPANLLSYHLRVLRESGLVTSTKRGRWVDYALAPDAFDRLCAALPVTPPLLVPR